MSIRKATRYIVFHTAAFDTSKGPFNVKICDDWHKQRGWSGCGYNFIITAGTFGDLDGEVQMSSRGEAGIGAHCRGINSVSIGICIAGNGDVERWTEAQKRSFILLTESLRAKYNVPVENIIGHREIGKVSANYATQKTCPGSLINCDEVRGYFN